MKQPTKTADAEKAKDAGLIEVKLEAPKGKFCGSILMVDPKPLGPTDREGHARFDALASRVKAIKPQLMVDDRKQSATTENMVALFQRFPHWADAIEKAIGHEEE